MTLRLSQSVHLWVATRELHTELNISFNALETVVEMLEYYSVYTMLIPRVLTQEQKEHHMQVCQDLLNKKKEAEGDSFLDHVTTTDKTWCHNYEPKSLQQSMEWQVAPCEFPIKENVQDATLSAYSDVHCPLQQERGDPSGFPGTQTTHQL